MASQFKTNVPGFVLPPITTSPVPFGVAVIAPFAPSVIVILPEFVPEFVSKTKSYAPLDVIVAAADRCHSCPCIRNIFKMDAVVNLKIYKGPD